MASKIKVDTIETADGTGNITVNNNVGIGVVPEAWHTDWRSLQIGGNSSIFADAAVVGGGSVHYTQNSFYDGTWKAIATGKSSYIRQTDGKIDFWTAPSVSAGTAITQTTAMTIENDGGTGSDISFGNFSTTTGTNGRHYSGAGRYCQSSSPGNGVYSHHAFYNSNGLVGSIQTSSTSTLFNTSSDYRLKENVVPMTGSIDRLKELKPSRFNFIADADTTVDGFLAHEAQAVVPECVSGEKDGMMMEDYEVTPAVMDGETVVTEAVMGEREVPDMQGIDQAKLVPLLVGAIQELTARLELLEDK
jgi:hypothetical protein